MFDNPCYSPFPFDKSYLLWLTYTSTTGQVWFITSDVMRLEYQLWKGKKKTARKADNPTDLYKYIKEG